MIIACKSYKILRSRGNGLEKFIDLPADSDAINVKSRLLRLGFRAENIHILSDPTIEELNDSKKVI